MKTCKPNLRFKGFKYEWSKKTLGEYSHSISSGRSTVKKNENGKYIIFGSTGPIGSTQRYEYSGAKILIARVGANAGSLYYVSGKYSVSDNTLILDVKDTVNIKFVLNLLKRSGLKSLVFGSGQPLVTSGHLKNLTIYMPPSKAEQQKIADFLSTIDKKIELLEQKKKAFEKYKKGLMQAIFSQKIRFKKPDGSNYPDWEEKKLSEVFLQTKGTGLSKDQLVEGGVNKCVLYGELYTTHEEIILDIESRTNSNVGVRSHKSDLLIPCSTTTTAVDLAKVTEIMEDGVLLGGDITILRSKEEICSTFYAYYLTHYKKLEIAKYAQGSTIVHLYYSHFQKIIIDVPSIKEQLIISEFIVTIVNKIHLIVNKLELAKQFKKGLLQQIFV